jgi:hypothetical protein
MRTLIVSLTARGRPSEVSSLGKTAQRNGATIESGHCRSSAPLPDPVRRSPSPDNDACGRDKLMSDDHIQREIRYFRDFSVIYTDAIRSSDFKANIALLFLPLLMVPILSAHERGLAHVPLWMILVPFLAAYFFLILAIFPRYLGSEKSAFHLSRTAGPHHFNFTHETFAELEEVKHRVRITIWYFMVENAIPGNKSRSLSCCYSPVPRNLGRFWHVGERTAATLLPGAQPEA